LTPIADIELVKRLVVEAGKRALARSGTEACEVKADRTLVTAVDRDTERFLAEELERAYPDFAFLGEEYGRRGPEDAPLWVCDPIDGTTGYVFGMPVWCVSVGLLHQGVPLLGALYLPRLDELFWAVKGEGAFCNGVPLHAVDRDELGPEDPLCIGTTALKSLDLRGLSCSLWRLGSVAAEVAYTARGNLCGTIGRREDIKDVAAALCIAFEAGCEFRFLSGPPVDIAAFAAAPDGKSVLRDDFLIYAPPRLCAYLQRTLRRLS
jgi:fructose-1,6-bisphosphatase/inositol monophosphatase family enzyme